MFLLQHNNGMKSGSFLVIVHLYISVIIMNNFFHAFNTKAMSLRVLLGRNKLTIWRKRIAGTGVDYGNDDKGGMFSLSAVISI